MIRFTTTQVRPNVDVKWAFLGNIGRTKLDYKITYPDYYLEEPIIEVSEDQLTMTFSVTFKDGFRWSTSEEHLENINLLEKYAKDNGIIVTNITEEV